MRKKTFEEPKFYISAFLQEDVLTLSNLERYDNTGMDTGSWGSTNIFGN